MKVIKITQDTIEIMEGRNIKRLILKDISNANEKTAIDNKISELENLILTNSETKDI